MVNRVGDFGFALGIFGLFYLVDSINMDDVFAAAPALAETNLHFLWTEWNAANLLAFLLFVGARASRRSCSCTPGFPTRWRADACRFPR